MNKEREYIFGFLFSIRFSQIWLQTNMASNKYGFKQIWQIFHPNKMFVQQSKSAVGTKQESIELSSFSRGDTRK